MAKQYLLTDRQVKEALCPTGKNFIYLNDGGGLRLRIRPNQTKTWIHRWKVKKTEYNNSLGSYPEVSIKEARELKIKDRLLTKQGKNPSLERRLSKYAISDSSRMTFELVAKLWMESNEEWSHTHRERTEALLNNHLKKLKDLPISVIDDQVILNSLLEIQKKGLKGTIPKAKSLINCVFSHAVSEKLIKSNPVILLTGNKKLKKNKVNHFKAIKRDDVGELFYWLSKGGKEQPLDFVTVASIYLTVYTGLRNNSIRGARWKEINFAKKKWTVPANRMKLGNEFSVPLPRQAIVVLKKLKQLTFRNDEDYIFQSKTNSNNHISENTARLAIKALGFDATQHGMRTLIQTTLLHFRFSPDAVDRQLDHKVEDKVREAYMGSEDFMEQRSEAMQFFADWCDDQHKLYTKNNDKAKNKS